MRVSRIRYSQSIAALKSAIVDLVKIKSDETLYTVLLLSGYEVSFDSPNALFAWKDLCLMFATDNFV